MYFILCVAEKKERVCHFKRLFVCSPFVYAQPNRSYYIEIVWIMGLCFTGIEMDELFLQTYQMYG